MNEIKAKVKDIQNKDELYLLNLSTLAGELVFVTLSVNLKIGDEISAGFRPSCVAISKNLNDNLSYSNQISLTIQSVNFGEILTTITGAKNGVCINSIITTNSAKRLNLQVGENVVFLIKATDIFVV